MRAKAQKAALLILSVCLVVWTAAALEVRTWTFSQDGQMKTSSGGSVSFKKKGRFDAAFVRVESTNVVLLAGRGEYLTIALTNLSDPDRDYVSRASRIDAAEAVGVVESAVTRNEMSRRKVEAAKLNDEAASKRRLADAELDAADQLDAQAANLANRAENLQIQAQLNEAKANTLTNPADPSTQPGSDYAKAKSDAGIASSAAQQLEQDVAKLRGQAQERRQKAANFKQEAVQLEKTASAELGSLQPGAH